MSQARVLLNVGCGELFHVDWINLDISPASPVVQEWDIKNGIPFKDQTVAVIYHSHLLEHLNKQSALHFIEECFRVLEPGGIIRVVVPDLENIATLYLQKLRHLLEHPSESTLQYDWMMLELYDQVVREKSGGMMAEFLLNDRIKTVPFLQDRIGLDLQRQIGSNSKSSNHNVSAVRGLTLGKLYRVSVDALHECLLKLIFGRYAFDCYKIGKFRKGGEIHAWMYDQFSLERLLSTVGFSEIQRHTAFTSLIPNWSDFELDTVKEVVRKPDSLYMEGKR